MQSEVSNHRATVTSICAIGWSSTLAFVFHLVYLHDIPIYRWLMILPGVFTGATVASVVRQRLMALSLILSPNPNPNYEALRREKKPHEDPCPSSLLQYAQGGTPLNLRRRSDLGRSGGRGKATLLPPPAACPRAYAHRTCTTHS